LKEDLEVNCGVSVDESTIYQILSRCGFTLKRNAFVARECMEEDRTRYVMDISQNYHPDQLIFVNKSMMNQLTMQRDQGWSLVGVSLSSMRLLHPQNMVCLLSLSHLQVPYSNSPLAIPFFLLFPSMECCTLQWKIIHTQPRS